MLEILAGKIDGEVREELEARMHKIKHDLEATKVYFDQKRQECDVITGSISEARYHRRLRGTANIKQASS